MNFRQWIEMKYLEWQRSQGGRKTVLEFAEYLDVSQQTVSNWMNATRQPQGDNIRKLSEELGLEVYDVLGLDRPDPDLHYIQKTWDDLTPKERAAIREQAEAYAQKNDTKRSSKKRRTAST